MGRLPEEIIGGQSALCRGATPELKPSAKSSRASGWIHCHAYRQDEILMLMRTLEPFGVKVTAFHHVLEGLQNCG